MGLALLTKLVEGAPTPTAIPIYMGIQPQNVDYLNPNDLTCIPRRWLPKPGLPQPGLPKPGLLNLSLHNPIYPY